MGVHGIYKEIGPGQRIALSKLAVQKFEDTGRPLRIAVDISIWLFQIQSAKGGTNPALRTFYYRLLRLISLCIQPLFVFDGPNKPPFKRNKRTGANVASIPEYLAKELLKKFGLPYHLAPGEAEAECALLQREGLVDAVLSEDVDTLMFGSGQTMRNWSSEATSSKIPTHVNLYDSKIIKNTSGGIDKDGMVLVALMSGGDYVPQGIAGCGPKTACEAAKAGFGRELCQIPRKDKTALGIWRERLSYELRTNESHFFRSKHKALKILPEFPDKDVLGYYTRPVVSSLEQIKKLQENIKWQQDIKIDDLRNFTAEAFDWRCISGAKKFIRNLAPVLLVQTLTKQSRNEESGATDGIESVEKLERSLIESINGKRTHQSTDSTPELRVGFVPANLVPIDLDAEPPDEPIPGEDNDGDETSDSSSDCADSSKVAEKAKKTTSLPYDPCKLEKTWIPESYVKFGVPLTVQDWEESLRNPKKYQILKARNKNVERNSRKKASKLNGTRQGAIKEFAKVTKPKSVNDPSKSLETAISRPTPAEPLPSTSQVQPIRKTVIDLLSSPAPLPSPPSLTESPLPATKRRQRSSFQRTQTLPIHLTPTSTPPPCPSRSSPIPSLDLACSPVRKSPRNPPRKRTRAGHEGLQNAASGSLDGWLHSSQGQSTAKSPLRSPRQKAASTAVKSTNASEKYPNQVYEDNSFSNGPDNLISCPLQPVSGNQSQNCKEKAVPDADVFASSDQTIRLKDRHYKRRFIHPRQSLKGTWKMSANITNDLQIIDLTSENGHYAKSTKEKGSHKKAWRVSQVDVLDMTEL